MSWKGKLSPELDDLCETCSARYGYHCGEICPYEERTTHEELKKLYGDSALTIQKGGDHYKKLGNYQPWEVLSHWLTPEELKGYMKGTVIAYLAREADKGGRLDIEKAMHTIQLYLELSKGGAE